jgi:hypothetical protein
MTTRHDDEPFLSRWSRLKREEAAQAPAPAKDEVASVPEGGAPQHKQGEAALPDLPPIEKLTPQSDFTAFMGPNVQDALRRAALKKLFSDPHFNVPDLNEAYSGDWTGGEPITEEMLKTLNQARTLLFPEEKKREEALEREEALQRERLAAEAAEPAPEDGSGESQAATTDTQEAKHDEPGRQDT